MTPKRKFDAKPRRREQTTYKLNKIEAEEISDPNNPFTLPMRLPGWFPDGIDLPWKRNQKLFSEEVVGLVGKLPVAFGVQFAEEKTSSQNKNPHKWILGNPIEEPQTAADKKKMSHLTRLVRELATRVRKYNASLYRLRRLHFFFRYKKGCFPPANPCGDPKIIPKPDTVEFRNLVRDSESNWVQVATELNDFLESAEEEGYRKIRLLGADMVEVNGYVVSMRVVVVPLVPDYDRRHIFEPGGSSSHVSISSAFSSS